MTADPTVLPLQLSEEYHCSCGEPVKVNRDDRLPPIGCPVCNSEWCFDDPKEFNRVAHVLRRYWLERGRRDYAGLTDDGA